MPVVRRVYRCTFRADVLSVFSENIKKAFELARSPIRLRHVIARVQLSTHWKIAPIFIVLLAAIPVRAQTTVVEAAEKGLSISRWAQSGSISTRALTTEPTERLRVITRSGKASYLVKLGRLAFRSPLTLGGNARRLGLSCNTCHPGGAVNARFFFQTVSDRPGNLDVSHRLWNPKGDDGLANPTNIPSLRGIRWTAPYGRDGRISSLDEFTRNVIVNEFAGREPDSLIVDALVAYQREFEFPPNANIQELGKPSAGMSSAAIRGAKLFQQDCASCHIPSSAYLDGRSHDVGTSGYFDTPTLRGLAESAPYLNDGRAADLLSVVAHFDQLLELGYQETQRADMTEFLEALGAVDLPPGPVTARRAMDRINEFATLLRKPIEEEEFHLAERIGDMLRMELMSIHERFHLTEHATQRGALVVLSIRLGELIENARAGKYESALRELAAWRDQGKAAEVLLSAGAATSLYDPETLQATIAEAE
jgi:cytochrome c peroxidase